MYLVNFATFGEYKKIQEFQSERLAKFFQDIFPFNDNWVRETRFYHDNKNLFETAETGFGYCSWKPLIMLEAFRRIDYGDKLLYSDTADEIYNRDFYGWADSRCSQLGGRLFNLNYYKHGEWTKRDCFLGMDCDTERYWNHRQLEAGTIVLEKNLSNAKLLYEWLYWNGIPHIINKEPNVLGKENLPGFIDHRTDQSILTNLVIRNGYETEYMENFRAYIKYNEFEKGMNLTKHTYG